ncbi:MAG: sulfurtransferase [Acidiferrobacter sp.]
MVTIPAGHGLSWATAPPRTAAAVVAIDTRRQAQCQRHTLAGARCLPPRVFLGPHGRLADFRDIRWLLGAADLNGEETAVVVGDQRTREDFVAGILYLAGQRRVIVVNRPLTPWLIAHPTAAGTGQSHGQVRTVYYTAWPRTRLIVFRRPLARALTTATPPYLLDGRPLDQYWGQRIRGLRGGHIPTAQPLPASRLAGVDVRISPPPGVDETIAYAENPYRSIAYFAVLRLAGWPVRVFVGGWRDWSFHTDLPVSSETYPRAPTRPPVVKNTGGGALRPAILLLVGGTLLLGAALAVYRLRRRR